MATLRSGTAKFGVLALCIALTVGVLSIGSGPALALGLKDCSDKYSAAKIANQTGTKTFAEFQKSDCGPDAKMATPVAAPAPADAKAAPVSAATPPAAAGPTPKEARAEKRRAAKAAKAAAAAPAATAAPATTTTVAPAATTTATTAVFPAKINDAYKAKKPAKARLSTCLDQYRANKTTNSNGGLKWIQKGGGYYSECNKKLKA